MTMKERTSIRTVARHRRDRMSGIPPTVSVLPAARENGAGIARADGNAVRARKRRTLLAPIDFTEPSVKALDHALSLAKRLNATVTLLHVVEGLYGEGFLD